MYRGNFQYRASSLQHLTIVSQENCFKIFDKFSSGLLNIYLNAYNPVGSSHPLQFYIKLMLCCVHDGSRQSVRVGIYFKSVPLMKKTMPYIELIYKHIST